MLKTAQICTSAADAPARVIGLLLFVSANILAQEGGASASDREAVLLRQLAAAEAKGASATFLPLEYLGAFYQQHKQWTKAADCSQQLAALWRSAAGAGSIGAASFEVEEAKSLAALGEYAKAEELLKHALVVLRQTPEIDGAGRAIALANLGEVLAKENKTDDARSSLSRALSELERTVGLHEPWLLAANHYGDLPRDNGPSAEDSELSTKIAKAKSESVDMESQGFVRPKPKRLFPPTYTSEAKRQHVSGTVMSRVYTWFDLSV